MNDKRLQFPIGKFSPPAIITEDHLNSWIYEISELPHTLRATSENLPDHILDTPYRPGGWTARQVIHHLADSHMNSYTRFKLAITESNPIVKPYFEDRWAECRDAKYAPIGISLDLISALHSRWVLFLEGLSRDEWRKTFYHPENKQIIRLEEAAGTYAWHGKHHLNHILMSIATTRQ